MFTILLAAVDGFGTADFTLLYLFTFIIDMGLINALTIRWDK